MSEEQLFNRMQLLNKAIKVYEERNDPKELLSLIYMYPSYRDDLMPDIYEYFKAEFNDIKEEYKSM